LLTVTTTQATSSTWLLEHFIKVGLNSEPEELVMFLSFTHDLQFHAEGLKKVGIDIHRPRHLGLFTYIDGCSKLFDTSYGDSRKPGLAHFLSKDIHLWFSLFDRMATHMQFNHKWTRKPIVIVEGMDVLHALNVLSAVDILRFIMDLQEHSKTCVVSVSGDLSFLQGSTPLADSQFNLISSLINRSNAVFALRPLDSGHAHDVTGTLRISRGGAVNSGSQVDETELQYFIGHGNTSVRLFRR
ncbi:uncharacterized protein V1516DRAFT_611912, partial [Lipomyces oligophaga]|uniref:uncharacterized protein n=1 Tax=Lipomyces oligophaga TaxID=45792 RepID=UPI0034CF6316